jgi:hypothetical protein
MPQLVLQIHFKRTFTLLFLTLAVFLDFELVVNKSFKVFSTSYFAMPNQGNA